MIITLDRISSGKDSTVGVLRTNGFSCFTCEDEKREVKVAGETRIPEGTYDIKLRTEGELHKKYSALYTFHAGMLWLQNVPGFEWIYLHTGNNDDHSQGCILCGFSCDIDAASSGGTIGRSVDAYKKLYPLIAEKIKKGEKVSIIVR